MRNKYVGQRTRNCPCFNCSYRRLLLHRSCLGDSALNDFLGGQIPPVEQESCEKLSYWLRQSKTASRVDDRGIAIGNLQFIAWQLLDIPDATPVALELLDGRVLPNGVLLRSQPKTSACSWENVFLGAYACYKRMGDLVRQKRVLELISSQACDPGVRNMAILRLSGLRIDAGDLKQAIAIASKADATGELSSARASLIEDCTEQLKKQVVEK